jgi:hypothetical protein
MVAFGVLWSTGWRWFYFQCSEFMGVKWQLSGRGRIESNATDLTWTPIPGSIVPTIGSNAAIGGTSILGDGIELSTAGVQGPGSTASGGRSFPFIG